MNGGTHPGMALVTGGGRGIGRAICLRLASDGHAVAVGYTSGADQASETVAMVRAQGGTAQAFQADIGDPAQIPPLFEAAEQALGPLGVLIANAGVIGAKARIDAQTPDDLTRLLSVNVLGTMLCAQQAVRRLSEANGGPGGAIVLISSVAARLGGLGGLVGYAASKGALESFTRGLASEVAREGIRVNAVAPGIVETDMASETVRAMVERGVPMGRMGQPAEIAEAVAWLVSPAAGFVTGSVLTASGGR